MIKKVPKSRHMSVTESEYVIRLLVIIKNNYQFYEVITAEELSYILINSGSSLEIRFE